MTKKRTDKYVMHPRDRRPKMRDKEASPGQNPHKVARDAAKQLSAYSPVITATSARSKLCGLCDHSILEGDEFRLLNGETRGNAVHERCLWKAAGPPPKAKPVPKGPSFKLSQGNRSDKTCPECFEELPLSGECGNCA